MCIGVAAATLLIAGGVAGAWHYAAPRLPSDWVRDRIVGAIESATGGRANIALTGARIRRTDEGPRLVLDGFALNDQGGKPMVGAPRAEIDFDLWTLLFGAGAVRRVELHDVEVKLALDRDGRIALSSEKGAQPVASYSGDWRNLVSAAASVLAGQEPTLAGLDRLALRNGRLVIDDPHHGGQVRYDNISIDLDTASRERRLTISANSAANPWSIVAVREVGVDDHLRIDVAGVPLADVVSLLRAPVDARSTAPVAGRIIARLRGDGTPDAIQVEVATRSGAMVLGPGTPMETAVSNVALKASWSAADGVVNFDRLGWRTGSFDAALSGSIRADADGGWSLDLKSGSGSVRSVRAGQKPIAFSRAEAKLKWPPDGVVHLPAWLIAGEGYEFRGDALIAGDRASDVSRSTFTASAQDATVALSFWPPFVADEARAYFMWAFVGGKLDRLEVKTRIDAAAREMHRRNGGLPQEALSVDLALSDLRLLVHPEFPAIEAERVNGRADGRYIRATTASAALETPSKSRATFTDVEFTSDISEDLGPSRIAFRSKGPAQPVFDLLETPLLRSVVEIGDDLDIEKGVVDLRGSVTFPVKKPAEPNDIGVTLNGSVTGLTIDGAVPDDQVTDVKATLSLDRGQFAMKGDGRVSGAPATLDVKRAANGSGEASLSVVLDDGARAKKGLPSAPAMTGPVPVKMTRIFGGTRDQPSRIEADLTRANINGVVPGWVKPAGRPGKVAFLYAPTTKKNADIELQDFVAESAGFLLRGSITLGPGHAPRLAKFSQARLSPGDEVKLDWERVNGVARLTIRGANFDARPLIRNIYNPTRDNGADAQDFEIDLKTAILTGHNSEAATNVEFKATRRGAELKQLQLGGRFGKSDVRGQLNRRGEGPGRILIDSADAGAFLRFIDLYRRMVGGHLAIDVAAGDARQDGQLVVKDFVLRNEPALRRAIGDQPAGGDSGDAGRARARIASSPAGDVDFEKVRVDFVRSAGRIDVKDGVMWGPVLGVQFEGIVDAPRDRIEVTGTYVPAYALNNAFAQVPVVGVILGGGQYGGLFGVNFKISGSFLAPAVMVNPLSAITPGVFRRFLEFNKQSVEGRTLVVPRDVGESR